MNADDINLIYSLSRKRLDTRGMANSKPGLWFQALEEIEKIAEKYMDAKNLRPSND